MAVSKLPTRGRLACAALKNKAVPKLAKSKKIGLRDGAERFLRDVLAEGNIKVVSGARALTRPSYVRTSALLVFRGFPTPPVPNFSSVCRHRRLNSSVFTACGKLHETVRWICRVWALIRCSRVRVT